LSGSARRTRRRQELIAPMPPDRADEPAGPGEIDGRDELMSALAGLPPRQRAVLVLRYFLDLPEAEVAAALQCSLGTVKSTASRGLARLEQAMRPAHDPRSIPT
jgi:RNA polymerase sigma factor (sigma-70 family)